MPQTKKKVAPKKTERKEALEAAKEAFLKRKREEKEENEENEEKEEDSTALVVKKARRFDSDEAEDEQEEAWNNSRPLLKVVKVPLAVPVLTEHVMVEHFGDEYSIDNVEKLLKDKFVFGKMKGLQAARKNREAGNNKSPHFSVPIYVALEKKTDDLGKLMVYKVRMGMNKKRAIAKPSQYEDLKTGKKKTGKELAEDLKKAKFKAWTANVPILDESPRDNFNCKVQNAVYHSMMDMVMEPDVWKQMGYANLCPNTRSSAAGGARNPIVDGDEGSNMRIKFTFQYGSAAKKFEIFDFRDPKNKKNPPTLASPSLINDFESIDGTFEVDDIYIRPTDYQWGYGLSFCAVRLYAAEEAVDEDGSAYTSKRIGQFEDSEKQEPPEDEDEEEGSDDEEEEEDGKK